MSEDNKGICWGNIAMVIGFIFLLIGFIFASIFFFKGKIYEGIEVTYGFGFLSIGFALFALAFSKKSDEKMKTISNIEFLKVINMLEDARIEFNKTLTYIDYLIHPKKYRHPVFPGYSPETFTWKTKSCVEMAVELLKKDETKKYIDPEYQDKLFFYFNMSFKHLFKIPNWTTETNSQKHLIETYALLFEYYNHKRRVELLGYINSRKENFFKTFYTEVAKKI